MVSKMNDDDKSKEDISKLDDLEKKLAEAADALRELKKDRMSSYEQNQKWVEKYSKLEKEKEELERKLAHKEEQFSEIQRKLQETVSNHKESKQEKILLEQMVDMETAEKHQAKTKYYRAIIVGAVAVALVLGVYSYMFAELAGQQYRIENPGTYNSGYVIQNLKGDTIDTFLSWNLIEGNVLYVKIVNAEKYSKQHIEAIRQAILSETKIDIDQSLVGNGPRGETLEYYLGWRGALLAASAEPTLLYIPTNFEILGSQEAEGDIVIELVNEKNGDGLTGWSVSIADDEVNQILKSRITIFEVNRLSPEQLGTITRHEFGHSLGLAHSTAQEDLMYPKIKTNYPYVSSCDIDAISDLYDGGKISAVICEE
jgi:hypothetical protein